MQFLGGHQRKSGVEIEAHLIAEYAQGAGAGAVVLARARARGCGAENRDTAALRPSLQPQIAARRRCADRHRSSSPAPMRIIGIVNSMPMVSQSPTR